MNRVIIMGRLASDPELRTTANGISVARFTVAVSRYTKDSRGQTDWIDCVAWRGTAEIVERYFSKGKQILVEGSIKTGTYDDKNGNKRKSVDVVAERVEFCGSRDDSGEKSSAERANGSVVHERWEDGGFFTDDKDLPF